MSRFEIIISKSDRYKEEIIELWRRNLPDTPIGRFEWLINNPHGPAIWYLAIDMNEKTIAGSVSIMPRKILIKGEDYLAGIVGDYMINKEYRVYGPAFQLMKKVVEDYSRQGIDFLYTFPNKKSEKPALRSGFKSIGTIKRFTKIVNTRNILKQYLPSKLAYLISPCIDFALKTFSKETYIKHDLIVDEILKEEDLSNLSWKGAEQYWTVMGDRGSGYIRWRYFQNPLHDFRIYVYREPVSINVLGQIIFSVINNSVHVFDFITNSITYIPSILCHFTRDVRSQHYSGISFRLFHDSPLIESLCKLGFVERNGDVPLLFAGDIKLLSKDWLFFDGDRNV